MIDATLEPMETTQETVASRRPSEVWTYLLVALTAASIYFLVLQMWHANIALPPWYAQGGDAFHELAISKNFFERGSFYNSPLIDAPLGGATYEFPIFDAAQLPIQWLLNVAMRNVFITVNLLYFLAIPAGAVTAFFAMRRLGARPWIAFTPAVLFSLLPRYLGGEGVEEVTLYWVTPFAALMCILVARADFDFVQGRTTSRRLTANGWCVLLGAALTGAGQIYYAFFTIVLLLAATAIATVKRSSVKPIVLGVGLCAIIFGGVVLQASPAFIYKLHYGRNEHALIRYPEASETYGLQIAQLLLPVQNHRGGGWLAKQRAYFDSRAPNAQTETNNSTLGAIAGVGFLALLGILVARTKRKLPYDLEDLALLNLTAVLLATVGSFGTLFSFFVNPDIRAYNRISLFIGLFALIALAQIFTYLQERWRFQPTALKRVAIAGLVLLFGIWDQVVPGLPPYQASAAEFQSDAQFVAAVESRIGAGAAFELPWMRFPEQGPIGELYQGELFRPYLHATTLRTTFGAVEGRDPYEWQRTTALLPTADLIHTAILGGFDGFIVFRHGYADNGAALEAQLRAALGSPVVSHDTSLAFYSMQNLRRRVIDITPEVGTASYADRIVRQLTPIFGRAFSGEVGDAGDLRWYSQNANATALVKNNSAFPRTLVFHALLDFGAQRGSLHIEAQGQSTEVEASDKPVPFDFTFHAPAGKTIITFSANVQRPRAPSSRQNRPAPYLFRLSGTSVTPGDLPTLPVSAESVIARAVAPVAPADEFPLGRVRLISGCYVLEHENGRQWNWCARSGVLRIESNRTQTLHFRAVAVAPASSSSHIYFDTGGKTQVVSIAAQGSPIDIPVAVSPSHPVILQFHTDAVPITTPDPRTLVVVLFGPSLR